MRVFTNDWRWGTVVKLGDEHSGDRPDDPWHDVKLDTDTRPRSYNRDRLSTTDPNGQPDPNPVKRVWFTGTLITYDGSDTDGYGEPCEPGHGCTYTTGYVDLSWDRGRTVHDSPNDVRPDTYVPDDDEPTEQDFPHDWQGTARCQRWKPGGGGCRIAGNGDDNGPCREHPLYPKDADPVTWLAHTIADRLGAIDTTDGSATFYAADSVTLDMTTGATILAAHAEGFTADEVRDATNKLIA